MTGNSMSADGRPPIFKAVGVSLAITSGLFIGVSFVLKKKGLLAANIKEGKEAGEGYGYLKNAWWWTGMILMILGEICNFCAYAFVEAILVTPLGALSVVITAILSSIFLKERLSFIGKIGCFMCIIGSIVIVINAPAQSSVTTIQDMQKFIISPGFLSYAGVVILSCIGIVIWVAPKYGNKSMMVYLTVCSLIGGLSVVATQGLGAAVISQISGVPQFNQWFLYVLLVFIVITLLVEIVYLNKALNVFNAALVTPTYYVFFTSSTIVTSAILFRGFKGTPSSIATVVMGFLQICSGVVLLQLSKSSKDVPDAEIFREGLDQIRTIAEQSEPESEPKADAIRGTAAIIRRISLPRRTAEVDEARRIHEERMRDLHTPHSIGETVEWDGVRRRVTWTNGPGNSRLRRNTTTGSRPPLGMARIPDDEEAAAATIPEEYGNRRRSMSVDEAMLHRVYGDSDIQTEGFLGKVKGLFITTQKSKASLKDPSSPDVASTSHRDSSKSPLRGGRLRVNTESGVAPRLNFAHTSPASQSSPHINQVTFESPTGEKAYGLGASQGIEKVTSGGSEYLSVPISPSISPPPIPPGSSGKLSESSRPDSRSSAKRQFSFQFMRRNNGGDDKESGNSHQRPITPGRKMSHQYHNQKLATDEKTEEVMIGLVKQGPEEAGLGAVSDGDESDTAISYNSYGDPVQATNPASSAGL